MPFDQAGYDLRCEWGEAGVAVLAPISDVVIIVDVLCFSTSVATAVGRGALVYPYQWKDESAAEYALSLGAELAGRRGSGRYSLSPASFLDIPAGTAVVLPSPNGATLSLATGARPAFAGCPRNSRAVAEAARRLGRSIAVVPCGERWRDSGALRPALEDLVGAGAILRHLPGTLSREARIAVEAFRSVEANLAEALRDCSSGRELLETGFGGDVSLASELDVETCAARLVDGAYRAG